MTPAGPEPDMSARLVVGTYARNGGAGLCPLYPGADGWSPGPAYAGAQNASFGTYSGRHGLLYLVDEDDATIAAFRYAGDAWDCLARLPAGGEQPCYVALDADETCLAVANYGSGSVALFGLDPETGLPLTPLAIRPNSGKGPVAERQEGPHAHCACFSPDRRWLYHVDLGTDEILAHPFDADRLSLGEARLAYPAPAGSGPRHLVFHPARPLALLASELASTLTFLEVGDGRLKARATVRTLPDSFQGESLVGHVSLGDAGRRVYVTNRGHDSIAVFAWKPDGLHLLQHIDSRGASPRAFALLEAERRLIVANEEAGSVAIFAVEADGRLVESGPTLSVPGAVFPIVVAQRNEDRGGQ